MRRKITIIWVEFSLQPYRKRNRTGYMVLINVLYTACWMLRPSMHVLDEINWRKRRTIHSVMRKIMVRNLLTLFSPIHIPPSLSYIFMWRKRRYLTYLTIIRIMKNISSDTHFLLVRPFYGSLLLNFAWLFSFRKKLSGRTRSRVVASNAYHVNDFNLA